MVWIGKLSNKVGVCGSYALRFFLKFNDYVGKNIARLVVANNPIPSGTYIVGEKVDVQALGFYGFPHLSNSNL